MKKLSIILIPIIIISYIAFIKLYSPKKFGGLTPVTYTIIQWNKPTTDAEWAEDVKQENFDIKSTDVLQEMLDSHLQLLTDTQKNNKIVICPECIKYDLQDIFSKQYGISGQQLTDEVNSQFQRQLDSYNWRIDKLNQSIERLNQEITLRQKGFVVPDKLDKGGTPAKVSDLQKVAPQYIRYIND